MLSGHIIETLKPLVAQLTPAQRLELIRWIASTTAELQEGEAPVESPDAWQARISAEAATWYARPAADRERYAGEYVAVLQGEVIDHGRDRVALYQRVRQQYPDTPVLVTAAETRQPREFLILSPRLERA